MGIVTRTFVGGDTKSPDTEGDGKKKVRRERILENRIFGSAPDLVPVDVITDERGRLFPVAAVGRDLFRSMSPIDCHDLDWRI